jgi:hypothetical protein
MANVRSGNRALRFTVNGKGAADLSDLAGIPDRILSRFNTAVQRATVGVKRRAGPAASRELRAGYNIRAGALRGKIEARESRSRFGDTIELWATARRTSLIEFGGKWRGPNSPGATAAIARGSSQTYKGAFIATIQGRRAVRVRSFNSATGRRFGRGPVRILRGPSVFEMLSGIDGNGPSIKVGRNVLAELTEFYVAELRRQYALES